MTAFKPLNGEDPNAHDALCAECSKPRYNHDQQGKCHTEGFTGTAWLIEFGSPAIYYCAPGIWCNNASHGQKFKSESQAREMAKVMAPEHHEKVRIIEHLWAD